MTRKTVGVLLSLVLCSLGVAAAYMSVLSGDFLQAYASFFVSWLSYFAGHYIENGNFVDGLAEGEGYRLESREELARGLPLVLVVLAGMVVFGAGLSSSDLFVSWAGSTTFLFGYAAVHQAMTGSLL